MTINEEKQRAKAEKDYLAMIIAIYSDKYTLEELRGMKLSKLQNIAKELQL